MTRLLHEDETDSSRTIHSEQLHHSPLRLTRLVAFLLGTASSLSVWTASVGPFHTLPRPT
jgi:hypothetical protein